jgi:hypothetical protein
MSPLYNTQVPPPALFSNYPQNTFPLFNGEVVLAGQFSQQVHIPPNPTGSADRRARFVITFDADPGAFEFDIMESDDDLGQGTNGYTEVPVSAVINALNPGSPGGVFIATVDLEVFQGQFCLLYCRTAPANNPLHTKAVVTIR